MSLSLSHFIKHFAYFIELLFEKMIILHIIMTDSSLNYIVLSVYYNLLLIFLSFWHDLSII